MKKNNFSTPASEKCILITGGAKRIGAAIVRLLHSQGMNIIIHYNNSSKEAIDLQNELNDIRENSIGLCSGNLANHDDCELIFNEALKIFGRIDALINNASNFFPTPIESATESQWDEIMAINLKAPFFLSKLCASQIKLHKGDIINLIDIYADRPLHNHPIYIAAKAGLAALTKSLAQDLGPEIRVNGIAPGAILWPESGGTEEDKKNILSKTPIKKLGSPEDIASTALFFLRDAPFITGQIISVDGGRSVVP